MIKNTIDFVQVGDFDQLNIVFSDCTFIRSFSLFSDKCGLKELEKLEEEFSKDLLNPNLKSSKATLTKFLRNTDKQKSP